MFLCGHKFSLHLSKIPGSLIARSCNNTMFSFVKNCQIVFQSDFTILRFLPAINESSFALHLSPAFPVVFVSDFSILMDVQQYLIVVLISLFVLIQLRVSSCLPSRICISYHLHKIMNKYTEKNGNYIFFIFNM